MAFPRPHYRGRRQRPGRARILTIGGEGDWDLAQDTIPMNLMQSRRIASLTQSLQPKERRRSDFSHRAIFSLECRGARSMFARPGSSRAPIGPHNVLGTFSLPSPLPSHVEFVKIRRRSLAPPSRLGPGIASSNISRLAHVPPVGSWALYPRRKRWTEGGSLDLRRRVR